ncbi:methionine--tRNA ligase [Nocardia amamiensis]|uniref:methionine--tRNA ligase n=1 Tax=Nocardia amamiensis TaxID=404578 RepID=UPI000836198F|nr:methionine--tRNA ligase [Nocardia amamiensis]
MSRFLITSALPYINGVKHLGNLVGSMLPADVYSRFLRAQGHEVLFVCGTDEHGTPAEVAAINAGVGVKEYCDTQFERQRGLGDKFWLSWDHFGRSSSPENHELTRYFSDRLDRNGYLEEREIKQLYSPSDRRFLPDRYVTGTCPQCQYPRARGDQCESCSRLLDPLELVDPRSTLSGATNLEVRTTRHLFLRQSAFEDRLRRWIDTRRAWPTLTTSIARKWLDEGLRDRCITRDLEWGVPVDRPEFENKVYYVWFDAPIEYIGATREWASQHTDDHRDWRSWWYNAADVVYTQFMAKDNIPFHTLSFPCTLLGSAEPWKLPDYIKGFNWLTYYGGKFSTSASRGIFMDDAIALLPPDYWRWFLIANAPENDDVDFTWEIFADTVNKDLADVLGNFVNRVLTFTDKHFSGEVPTAGTPGAPEEQLADEVRTGIARYTAALTGLNFRVAAAELRHIWSLGNQYWDVKRPWHTLSSDPDDAASTVRTAVNLISAISVLSAPVIPQTAAAISAAVHDVPARTGWPGADHELNRIRAGARITNPGILFTKVLQEQVEAWRQRFGASE